MIPEHVMGLLGQLAMIVLCLCGLTFIIGFMVAVFKDYREL